MALTNQEKEEIITKFATKTGDTGSPQVQISLLTKKIMTLNEHLKTHRHDESSRYGLVKMVGQRRRQLKYLARTDQAAYRVILGQLGLRK